MTFTFSRGAARKRTLLLSCAVLPAIMAAGAAAQDAEEPAPSVRTLSSDRIIVTARQRSESLQDVPATITAFVESEIETANIMRPQDFIALTPGLAQVQSVEIGDMQVAIRGINSGRDTESSIALIIDGVLVTNPNALNQELDNVTQIEVLKGPQGALYGRNALAGAIILTTRKPTDDFEGFIKAGYGRHNLFTAGGGVSGPLFEGMRASVNAYHRQEDGSFVNSLKGCDDCENQLNETGLTGRILYEPTDKLEFDVKARYSDVKAGGVTFNASLALTDAAAFLGVPSFFEDPNDHEFIYINKVDTDNRQETLNLSGKIIYDTGFADLLVLGTYNDVKNKFISPGVSNAFGIYNANDTCQAEYANAVANPEDFAVPPPFFYTPDIANSFLPPYPPISCGGWQYQQRDQKDWSIEARLTSNQSGPLQWMIGAYYANIDRHLVVAYGGDIGIGVELPGFVPGVGPLPTDLLYDDDLLSDVYAGFANATYDIQNNLELAVALRYDVEKREVDNNVPKIGPQTPGFGAFGAPVCPSGPASCTSFINPFYNANPGIDAIPSRKKTFKQVQPKVTLNWTPADQLTLFGSYGLGFRSGGFNSSGTTATLTQFFGGLALPDGTPNLNSLTDDFKKEVSKAAELGLKATLLDNQLSLNAAIFRTELENGQDFSFFAGPFGSLRVVTNVDKSILRGFEADFRWTPVDRLKLYGGFGYTNSEIKEYSTRPYTAGNKVAYVPEYNGNVGAEYAMPIFDNIDGVFRVDQFFMGKTWFSPVQDDIVPNFFTAFGFGRGDFSKQFRKPYTTTNMTFTLQGESWNLSAWVQNLFDKDYLAEVIPAPEFGGSFIHDSYGRTYGVRAKKTF